MGERLVLPGFAGIATGRSRAAAGLLVYAGSRAPARLGAGIRTVLGTDERSHVTDTSASPWRMVCHLEIEGPFNTVTGTGWFVGPRTVLTAGHCVFDAAVLGGWATRIRMSPGMRDGDTSAFGSIQSTRFATTDAWRLRREADFDLGAIHLDAVLGRPDPGSRLGWFGVAALSDTVLQDAMVNVTGYPADKPAPPDANPPGTQQWHARNRVTHVTARRIFYEVDTEVGQSGSPAYVVDQPGAAPLVVGVHAYGVEGSPAGVRARANSGPRMVPEVLRMIEGWVGIG